MITIKTMYRKYDDETDKYSGNSYKRFLESANAFIKRVEEFCNSTEVGTIISIQFFDENGWLLNCIITYTH